ncbi:MAG: hypothetical protein ABR543_05475 [Gemmatimonadaceae bacterium]
MVDKAQTADAKTAVDSTAATASPAVPPKRPPGHRHTDVRDTVAEMAARAQEISQEAGSKVAGAMKDVISAAAGLAGFAVESARDLVQYMVRRGQMTQEEADKLIREAEAASSNRKPHSSATSAGRHDGPRAAKISVKKAAPVRSAKTPRPVKAATSKKKTAPKARAGSAKKAPKKKR